MKTDRMKNKRNLRIRRQRRVRAKIQGVTKIPRLCVFRSLKYIYAQIIDEQTGKVLAAADDRQIKKGNKTERAQAVGSVLAEKALAKKVKKVVFDRAGYQYHGRVKSLADGARAGGLEF
ncbi:MAG: 50S ribosomal protein L18 [Patescibacteria group bacterium]